MATGNGRFEMLSVDALVLDQSNPRVARFIEMYGGQVSDEQMGLALGAATVEFGKNTTTFHSLRAAIRTHGGLIHPILVNKDADDNLVVIEGNTRALIYRQFRDDHIAWKMGRDSVDRLRLPRPGIHRCNTPSSTPRRAKRMGPLLQSQIPSLPQQL